MLEKGHLSISGRQAIIKFIEKKSRGKRCIKSWRHISLLNVDLKNISKAVLPHLISSQQTAYVKNRHIGEGGRLISNVIEFARLKKIEKCFCCNGY